MAESRANERVILSRPKGCSRVVILNKRECVEKVTVISSDTSKFTYNSTEIIYLRESVAIKTGGGHRRGCLNGTANRTIYLKNSACHTVARHLTGLTESAKFAISNPIYGVPLVSWKASEN